MTTLFNEILYAIRGRCISDESASVAAAEVAELVVKKFTPTNKNRSGKEMNTEQFETILESRLSSIKQVLGNKAKEYAIGDRLYNFKRAAEISRTTPQQALAGMFMKHLVSVLDLVEGSVSPTENMVNEKIGDAINYLILLEAILKEPPEMQNNER